MAATILWSEKWCMSAIICIFAKTKVMKLKNHYILSLCVAALVVVCFLSISRPMRFNEQREMRETAVKTRLVKIRNAAERYCKQYGTYASSLQELVQKGFLADSLQFIPFSENERFSLSTTTELAQSGRAVPLMECGALYQQYLNGLDENEIANLIAAASKAGRYPGLKIGDVSKANSNAGNWE